MTRPMLSFVIPTLNEADSIRGILSDLAKLELEREVIVVDGGSADATRAVAARAGARVIEASRGRGPQLIAGAERASAPLLCFLHADVRLDERARAVLTRYAGEPNSAPAAFRLRIGGSGVSFRIIEAAANLRSRFLSLPYGDQGLLVRREDYLRAGGHPPVPLMEDVALVRSLNAFSRVRLLPAAVTVSPRRWLRDGTWRRSVGNLLLLVRYIGGAPPEELAERYRGRSRSCSALGKLDG